MSSLLIAALMLGVASGSPATSIADTSLVLPSDSSTAAAVTDSTLISYREQARALAPVATTALGRRFLAALAALPPPPQRTVYIESRRDIGIDYYNEIEARTVPEPRHARLDQRVCDGRYYYQTRYGTPFTYLNMVDIIGQECFPNVQGRRILDFGYGRIGHLRALASLGAEVIGIDVDPMLRALYSSAGDQGPVKGMGGAPDGSVRLVHGYFPGDATARDAVGDGYDLIIAKNVLNGGQLPAQREAKNRTMPLGVGDSVFVRAIHASLKPGGWFLIYTSGNDKGNPESPFSESMFRSAGFEVAAFDKDDTENGRSYRLALGYKDQDFPRMRCLYTLVRRPE